MPQGEFENWNDLACHAASRPESVRSIRARVRRSGAILRTSYRLEADIARICVPSTGAPLIGFELWRHTCFEAFIRLEGATAYHEFNFAPSMEWTVYSFSAYRNGAALTDETMNPQISVRTGTGRLELDATVQLDQLPDFRPDLALRLGLAAVIETSAGSLSYWALHHPADKPDFHNPDSFVLRLESQAR